MTTQVTYCDDRTFKVGTRVRYEGHLGTVIGFTQQGHIRAEIDQPENLPRHERWILNGEAAARHGHPDFCRVRDHGRGAGCFEIEGCA